MRALIALGAGALFGMGLALSGMIDPHRVQAFLDLFGAWDPTLAFVMAGALLPMAIAWRVRARMAKPLAGETFAIPDATGIDARLCLGAVLFGIGWGLGGLCPGPAFAALALAPFDAAIFVFAMLAGMALQRLAAHGPARRLLGEKA